MQGLGERYKAFTMHSYLTARPVVHETVGRACNRIETSTCIGRDGVTVEEREAIAHTARPHQYDSDGRGRVHHHHHDGTSTGAGTA